MAGRPPDLGGEASAVVAEGFEGRGEQQGFGDGADLGVKIQLARLTPELGEGGRGQDAGDDLHFFAFEGVDLGRIVSGGAREAAGIDEPESFRLESSGESGVGIGVGVAVGFIGPEGTNDSVGGKGAPHVGEDGNQVFHAPEEVISPVEGGVEIAASSHKVDLPGSIGGDTRHAIPFT